MSSNYQGGHTLDGLQADRAIYRARTGCKPSGDYQDPSVQMNNYGTTASLIPNMHRAKPMKESDRQRAGTLNNWGFIYQGGQGSTKSRVIRIKAMYNEKTTHTILLNRRAQHSDTHTNEKKTQGALFDPPADE